MIYTFKCDPYESPNDLYFAETEKATLNYMWDFKGTETSKSIFKKNKVRGLTLIGFQIYCKAMVTKQCGTRIKTDMLTHGMVKRAQK